MSPDAISIVERAYDLDHPERWLANLGEALRPLLDEGLGMCAMLYDASAPAWVTPLQFHDMGMPPAMGGLFTIPEEHNETVRAAGELEALTHIFRTEVLKHALDVFAPHPTIHGYTEQLLRSIGVEDLLCVNCVDPSAIGCFIGVPQKRRQPLKPAQRRFWGRIAAHIAAGYRIHRGVARLARDAIDTSPEVEAVIEADGRIQHAQGEATDRDARATLRRAALRHDAARGSLRGDTDAALDAWEGLISGRWSLVDRFDSDGRRYLLARRNDPSAPDVRGLTLRERQVVGYAALGHANKLIAYELGLSQPAVSNNLKSAARKLGVRTRAELVELFTRLSRV